MVGLSKAPPAEPVIQISSARRFALPVIVNRGHFRLFLASWVICSGNVDSLFIFRSFFALKHEEPYVIIAPLPTPRSEGGERPVYILEMFLLSVLASVVAYYICKWLDGE